MELIIKPPNLGARRKEIYLFNIIIIMAVKPHMKKQSRILQNV